MTTMREICTNGTWWFHWRGVARSTSTSVCLASWLMTAMSLVAGCSTPQLDEEPIPHNSGSIGGIQNDEWKSELMPSLEQLVDVPISVTVEWPSESDPLVATVILKNIGASEILLVVPGYDDWDVVEVAVWSNSPVDEPLALIGRNQAMFAPRLREHLRLNKGEVHRFELKLDPPLELLSVDSKQLYNEAVRLGQIRVSLIVTIVIVRQTGPARAFAFGRAQSLPLSTQGVLNWLPTA